MAEDRTEVKTLGYMVDGEWRDSKSDTWVDITDSNTGEVIARTPMCTEEEVTEAIESANAAYPAWASMPIQKRTEVLFTWRPKLIARMDEIATLVSTELGKNLDEARGEVIKIIEAIDVAVGAPMVHEGRVADERGHRSRHGQLPRAARRLRRHRAVQLPGHDPLRLDAADLHRQRQHVRAQVGQLRAAHEPPAARHAVRVRPAQGRRQHGDGRKGAGRSAAQASGRARRQLRRHHAGRQARLLHRRRSRQARPGADAGQKPRPRAARRLARACRPRHHQLHLRLRRHALHGPAGLRGRERDRRRVRRRS